MKRSLKCFLAIMMSVLLIVSNLQVTAYADGDEEDNKVSYLDVYRDNNRVWHKAMKKISNYEVITGIETELVTGTDKNGKWYVVKENVVFDHDLTITSEGDGLVKPVNLIICDGCKVTFTNGAHIDGTADLKIYGQSEGTGKLVISTVESKAFSVYGGQHEVESVASDNFTMYNGTVNYGDVSCSVFTVHGGNVEGNGSIVCVKSFTIYGGVVNCGNISSTDKGFTISGGTLKCTGIQSKFRGEISGGVVITTGDITITNYELVIEGGDITCKNISAKKYVTIEGDMTSVKAEGITAESNYVEIKGGTLVCGTITAKKSSISISDGEVKCGKISAKRDVTISNGVVTIDGGSDYAIEQTDKTYAVTISGGCVTDVSSKGGIWAKTTINLGWKKASDSIQFNSYYVDDAKKGIIKINSNQYFYSEDNNAYYTDKLTSEEISAIGGKKLVPANIIIDPDIENGAVSAPSYAEESSDVTLTIKPDLGYVLDTLTVMNGDTEITVTDNTFTMPAGIVNVTATFTEGYIVSFAKGDENASGEMDPVTVEVGEGYELPECGFTAPENMEFKEWSVQIGDADAVTKDPGDKITVTADTTVTAVYKMQEFEVSFAKGDENASGEMDPVTVEVGEEYELPECGFTAPENMEFKEWSVQIGDADAVTKDPGDKITVTADTTVTAVWKSGVPAFKSHSLVLTGLIGVNFFMDLPEIEGVDYETSYMEFSISGVDGEDKTWIDNFAADEMNEAGTYYAFTYYLTSIEMADTITAVFHYTQGSENKTIEQTYSVAQYMVDFDAVADQYSFATVDAVHALADYGHYVQPVLAAENGWNLGTDHAVMDAHRKDGYTEEEIASVKNAVSDYDIIRDTNDSGVEAITYRLRLDSGILISVYLKQKKDYTGNIAAYISDREGNAAVLQPDGRYRVQITDISAHELANFHTIKVVADKEFTITVSALSYVQTMLNSPKYENDTDMINALVSIYNYYDALTKYRQQEG